MVQANYVSKGNRERVWALQRLEGKKCNIRGEEEKKA